MDFRKCFLLATVIFGILLFTSSCSNAGDSPKFPVEKAKAEALASLSGGVVIGWHDEGNGNVTMYLFAEGEERYQRNFVFLQSDEGPVWLMIIPPFGSMDARFKVIK